IWCTIPENTTTIARRNYDEAILDSCNQSSASDAEKDKTLWIIDSIKLQPFAVIDSDNIEDVALMHRDKLANRIKQNCSNVVRLEHVAAGGKRKWETVTSSSIPNNDVEAALLSTTHYGPYAHHLSHQQYSELDDAACQMMNDDWILLPQLRFACPQLLAGAIVMNESKEAVILNSIEIYGRDRTIDVHRERCIVTKDNN
ncbi:hypothetical protein DFQ29_000908, partial [Apophysomyces sp. BC1021]